jgi:hypothetical protein
MDFKLKRPYVDPKVPYGQRLLVRVVEETAKENPSRVVCKAAKSSDISKGFLDITAGQVVKAVDYMSFWLQEKLQNKTGQETTIAFMVSSINCFLATILIQTLGTSRHQILGHGIRSYQDWITCNSHSLLLEAFRETNCGVDSPSLVEELNQ